MKTRVYIAGPISKGPIEANILQATDAHIKLLRAGYAPLCPHLSCYLGGPVDAPKPHAGPCGTTHDDWINSDLPWVAVSHAVLRLPGTSEGADLETALAEKLHIPVFPDVASLLAGVPNEVPDAPGGDPRFHELLSHMAFLHERKAHDYGAGEDPLANVRAAEEYGVPGWLGVVLRMNDKMVRLKAFAKKGSLKNESAEDSLIDIAAYALIAVILLREKARKEGGKSAIYSAGRSS